MRSGCAPADLDIVKAIITGYEGSPEDMHDFVTAWRRIDASRAGAKASDTGLLAAPVADLGLISN
jgi:hypothetical protein